ncbi:MAG: hypothetical protein RJA70_3432 [Pseudomonadota bacterium]|jgi:serine/threonine-protein kinase
MTKDEMNGRVVLGRYRIIKPLARGGMGVVYLGRTEGAAGFARPVVVKRILPHLLSDPEMAKMFVREARILSNLHHPGIVGVIDFGEEDSAYVMVLEYVHGYDVGLWRKYLARQNRDLPADFALEIVIRVLDALHYAHTLKRPDGTLLRIIHRDVSPGNILLDVEGHVRLLDFGIARIANDANEYKTQDATFKGKLAYAPPELLKGKEPSPQSDLYSCAVVLYQLLTAENPFRGASAPETLSRVASHTPRALRETMPNVPATLDAALSKALRKEPEERFQTAAEFADALRRVRSAPDGEVIAAMTDAIQYDFHGDMPAQLGLEPLHDRDAAWREAEALRVSVGPLRSSRPSPAPDVPPPYDPLSSTPPHGSGRAANGTNDSRSPRGQASPGSRTLTWAIGALALAVTGVAGAILLRPQPATSGSAARYLVVTHDEPSDSAAQPVPEMPLLEDSRETVPEPRPVLSATPSASPDRPDNPSQRPALERASPDPRRLTQTFSRRQSSVQACFSQNPADAKKTPRLEIAFSVNDAGRVTTASLVPSSLGATPMGSCILGVAKGTSFGALTDGVSFRIPVRARTLK